nr:MAG TPA: hypothetical protein [Bacteriophage sp.]
MSPNRRAGGEPGGLFRRAARAASACAGGELRRASRPGAGRVPRARACAGARALARAPCYDCTYLSP